ncbi:peptide deformylase [Williamsoniiplasma luminosum]|uniref:Peptide deformylase n=1 Tax=Williamsoniiplasma luminosum TaxID=214888 RepID=A0A2K8NTA5_9MOLU|nr:peptide deformylase [Williamsoniiplasma luminosum]ATZ17072.1 peptide deformylase [Williamsoniiplasma luminosum]
MKFNIDNLLQKEIPSNKWLIKDANEKIIRAFSSNVEDVNNLSVEDEICMQKLIDFVRYSQDSILNDANNPDHLRPAVGLAAPQIGVNKNMFYMRIEWPVFNDEDDINEDETSTDNVEVSIEEYAMINPKYLAKSAQICAIESGEGCLSVDGDREGIVPRAYKIDVEGYDYLTKKNVKLTLRGYSSIVFQHELDHNEGNLYYDLINKDDANYVDESWILI